MQGEEKAKCWVYRIRVVGALDPSWSDWFSGMQVSIEEPEGNFAITTLAGPVIDQAALYGILRKLEGLNLELLSVSRDPTQDRTLG